jgi:polyisoprenoid-binding protein YceI
LRKTLIAILLVIGAAVLVTAGVLMNRGRPSQAAAGGSAATSTSQSAPAKPEDADNQDGDDDVPPAQKVARRPSSATQAAPVWTVDKAASRLTFRGVMNGTPFDGVFRDWDAQIAFDPKNLANSRASVTVETASALTGQPIKDQALPNSEWLSVEQHPQATLVTRSIRQVGSGRYEAIADVDIRGVHWRTTVPFTVSISHDQGHMTSTLSVDRRTFGIGEGPFQSPAPVEPMVQVTMKLVAKKSR